MAKILLEARDDVLIASTEGVITSDTISVPCSISFSDEWAPYGKTIFFYQNPRKMYRVVVAGQGADIEVPSRAINANGVLYIGVFGNYTADGKTYRKVAAPTNIVVAKGSYSDNNLPDPPTVSEYEQMISIMMAYMDAKDVVDAAEKAAADIEADRQNVENLVGEAEGYSNAAVEAQRAAEGARDESLAAISEALAARDQVVDVAEDALNEMGGYNAKVRRNREQASNAESASSIRSVDATVAYSKTFPENALPFAEVSIIGGATYGDGGVLRSTPVTAVESAGANLITPAAVSKTVDGVTFVVNADGSIRVHGTATANHYYRVGAVNVAPGTYTLSGSLKGGSSNTFVLYLQGVGVSSGGDTGNNKVVTLSAALSCDVLFLIRTGATVDGTLRPMFNKGSAALPYSPYYKETMEIPEALRSLDGYGDGVNGDVYNYIDFNKKQFVKRVGKVDMGTLSWIKSTGYAYSKEITASIEGACVAVVPSEVSRYYINDSGYIMILFPDASYANADAVKTALSGKMLCYELSVPEITDISDMLSDDNLVNAEFGGVVTMVNENGDSVPSTIVSRIPKIGEDYVMISSPNGTVYKLTVSDSGSISAVKT